jgi:hypothetical protein
VLAETRVGLEVEVRVAEPSAAIVQALGELGAGARLEDGLVKLRIEHEARLPEIVRWLVGHEVTVYEIRCRVKTLEEWFIEIMGEDQGPG